jgi:hypothetical protein
VITCSGYGLPLQATVRRRFYTYWKRSELIGRIQPQPGNAVGLMRRPDNTDGLPLGLSRRRSSMAAVIWAMMVGRTPAKMGSTDMGRKPEHGESFITVTVDIEDLPWPPIPETREATVVAPLTPPLRVPVAWEDIEHLKCQAANSPYGGFCTLRGLVSDDYMALSEVESEFYAHKKPGVTAHRLQVPK